MKLSRASGFTLLELMVTVAILGILMSIAIPSYHNMQNSAVVNSVVSEWRDSFYYAQSEAMRLKQNIIFCASNDGNTCAGKFKQGWIVKHENRILRDIVPSVSSDKLHMQLNTSSDRLEIEPNGNIKGFAGATLQTYIIDGNNASAKRGLVISREGRMRTTNDFETK